MPRDDRLIIMKYCALLGYGVSFFTPPEGDPLWKHLENMIGNRMEGPGRQPPPGVNASRTLRVQAEAWLIENRQLSEFEGYLCGSPRCKLAAYAWTGTEFEHAVSRITEFDRP